MLLCICRRIARQGSKVRPARRHRGAHGAAMVEAAIVLPLLLVLTAGIVEYGLAFHQSAALAAASRAAARTASAMPKNDQLAANAADSASSQLQGTGEGTPDEVWIFRVDPLTNQPYGTFPNCQDCAGFKWDPAQRRFDTSQPIASDPWDPGEQDACAGQSDEVGVTVKLTHKYLFGVFGSSKQLSHTTVMRLEPYIGSQACGRTG